jgi:nicotinamide riboside transporter PnuC
VVQLTFVALAGVFGWWAWRAFEGRSSANRSLGEAAASLPDVIGLGAVAVLALVAAIVMGFRTVKGPEPPKI